MKISDFSELLPYFSAARSSGKPVLVITHERPDGDAAGSSAGMTALLRDNGFSAELLLPDEVPDNYKSFLPKDALRILSAAQINENYSLIVNTDASTVKRLGIGAVSFEAITVPFVTLDHHPDNGIFGDASYVDSSACSACEIVYRFAVRLGWKITPQTATLLYLGLVSDTGCFRYDNTSSAAFETGSALLKLGADHHLVVEKAYFSKSLSMARFEAELFCKGLHFSGSGRYAWLTVTQDLLKKHGIDIRNTENLIENIRCIDGLDAAALVKQTANPGIYKISLRSKNPAVSVGNVARFFSGGGHEMAAGCTIYAKTPGDAERVLLKHVEQEINGKK